MLKCAKGKNESSGLLVTPNFSHLGVCALCCVRWVCGARENVLKNGMSDESGSHCRQGPPGYIIVKEEYEDEPLELELENDGNLRMSTLISQFRLGCSLYTEF